MFDRKAKLMLMLALLNEIYGDVRAITTSLEDFVKSHPEMGEEMEEFGLINLLERATDFEKTLLKVMEKIKREIYE